MQYLTEKGPETTTECRCAKNRKKKVFRQLSDSHQQQSSTDGEVAPVWEKCGEGILGMFKQIFIPGGVCIGGQVGMYFQFGSGDDQGWAPDHACCQFETAYQLVLQSR